MWPQMLCAWFMACTALSCAVLQGSQFLLLLPFPVLGILWCLSCSLESPFDTFLFASFLSTEAVGAFCLRISCSLLPQRDVSLFLEPFPAPKCTPLDPQDCDLQCCGCPAQNQLILPAMPALSASQLQD